MDMDTTKVETDKEKRIRECRLRLHASHLFLQKAWQIKLYQPGIWKKYYLKAKVQLHRRGKMVLIMKCWDCIITILLHC